MIGEKKRKYTERDEENMEILWILIPLMLYDLVNSAVVLIGMRMLPLLWAVSHWQTVIKMTGTFLAAVAMFPFYRKVKEKKEESMKIQDGIFVAAAGAVLGILLNIFFSQIGFTSGSEVYQEVAGRQYGVPVLLGSVFYGMLSPTAEELLFRGVIYQRLKKNMGWQTAAAGSALLFGIFHGNIVQFVYGSIMGLFLAAAYERYRTLAAPIVFHGAANLAVYLLCTTG